MLSLRFDPQMNPRDPANRAYQANLLWFDDGSLKGLAAFMNFLGLLVLEGEFGVDDLRNPKVKELLVSLLRIPTIYKTQHDDQLDSQIGRVIKQNQDAQAQPVSSYGWACLLSKLSRDGTTSLDFDAALKLYNAHPAVQALGESDAWLKKRGGLAYPLLTCKPRRPKRWRSTCQGCCWAPVPCGSTTERRQRSRTGWRSAPSSVFKLVEEVAARCPVQRRSLR